MLFLITVACSQTEQSSFSSVESLPQALEQGVEQLSNGQYETQFPSASTLFARQANDEMADGTGRVVRLLADDNKGSRHQKFLVSIAGGQTLLFAHNIDLALRIDTLKVGDTIEFRGEYSYNPKGGVVHWTHLDPCNQHEAGWIKHNGITYQ
ncbi:MAG: DUF3465 domain-containing protein [Methylophilaceae bacterium]|nr:DUF3465 domain-containing protein [Methylophilaceae bacterium]